VNLRKLVNFRPEYILGFTLYKSKNSFAKTSATLFNSGTASIKPNGPDTNLLTKSPRNHTHNHLSPAKTLSYSVERRSVMT